MPFNAQKVRTASIIPAAPPAGIAEIIVATERWSDMANP
jgi:hypothetical protein